MARSAEDKRAHGIFFPYAFKKFNNVKKRGTRFVHYTQAETAINILRSEEFWMRKTSCMIDYMEVDHGLNCLIRAWDEKAGTDLRRALENIFAGITSDIQNLFNSWMDMIRKDTYITCVSEHKGEEDYMGRLSMWRSCGGTSGVALVMNNKAFVSESDALKAYTHPVAYLNDEGFQKRIAAIARNIQKNSSFVSKLGRTKVINYVFNAFKFAAICTKHPGFQEEKEWRVIYTPTMVPSKYLIKKIKVIDNIPQPIYKIPLKNIPAEDFYGVEIPELLDRIIIGPTKFPVATYEAFWNVLSDAGIANPQERISLSDIPLRM